MIEPPAAIASRSGNTLLFCSWNEWWDNAEHNNNIGNNNNNDNSSRHRRRLLLDVRNETEHRRLLCCNNSCNAEDGGDRSAVTIVHIPLSDLQERLFELPPRQIPFAILTNLSNDIPHHQHQHGGRKTSNDDPSTQLRHWQQELESVLFPHANTNRRRMADPCRIISVINANCAETWKQAAACGISIHTNTDDNHNNNIVLDKPVVMTQLPLFRPEPRLWQPDPLIEHVLLPLLKQELAAAGAESAHPKRDHNHNIPQVDQPTPPDHHRDDVSTTTPPATTFYEIWDLGSGVGRDVAFLAEELLRHSSTTTTTTPLFRVVGLDQRYRNKTTTTGDHETSAFWKRRHCEEVTECRCIDLNDIETLKTELHSGIQRSLPDDVRATTTSSAEARKIKCLYAVRYWNRALFQLVAQLGRDQILEPGTMVAISQFGKPSIGASWDFAHPKVRSNLFLF